ncbi:MAG: Flp pilus assembly complex ATPase component TadA [Candidatus Omnitrophica bacterium]|nr:Flp pilus assembly complex ATPase component TadA [Candidatus Omnitrophota bacterium]
MLKLGELLIKKGTLSQGQLDMALREHDRTGELLGKALVRMGFISEDQLLMTLAEQLSIQFIPKLKDKVISDDVIRAVPARFVWHYKFMPIALKGNLLTIAISNPLDIWPTEDIKFHLGFEVEVVLAVESEIMAAVKTYYGLGAAIVEGILDKKEEGVSRRAEEGVTVLESPEKMAQDASVIKLVNQLLAEAIQSRATDIHIEPYRDRVKVRYRIDGILYDVPVPETIKQLHPAIVSRIKIISNMDIVERRLPQDGRAKVKLGEIDVDLRISVIPTLYGENMVIRILPTQMIFNIGDLGLSPGDLLMVDDLLEKPHGIIFLTGPTGSGKTTTLYSFLSKLNKPDVKIITIEDPIEYDLTGITQVQVNPKIGLTFASALRNLLRHDPDIMMVGEVRDLETGELAIRTALTGHLVFSTLHTNDAASAVTRLVDMGIEPYLVASSVQAFIAQRLVRTICTECKESVPLKDIYKEKEATKDAMEMIEKPTHVFRGKGCEACKFTGYKGRIAIYEILLINEAIRQLVLDKASASQIKKKAIESGLRTLLREGWQKIREGVTTPEEVMRVTELG